MESITDWEALSALAGKDRRRGKRLPLACPVEVTGVDQSGKPFVDMTVTLDISEWGCRVLLKTKLIRGEVVSIRLLGRLDGANGSEPRLFEIMWAKPANGQWEAGASRVQGPEIWPVKFPPGKPAPDTES